MCIRDRHYPAGRGKTQEKRDIQVKSRNQTDIGIQVRPGQLNRACVYAGGHTLGTAGAVCLF